MRRLLLFALLLASVPCQAGVVSRDLFEPGDGLLTYDDVNQREWLDFSVSSQLFDPADPATIELPTELNEFRVATAADVEGLMRSAEIRDYPAWTLPTEPASSTDLLGLLGMTGAFTGSVLGDMQFSGGFVAQGSELPFGLDNRSAVLAFNAGVARVPGALNRPAESGFLGTGGYYSLSVEQYPFADGPVDVTIPDAGDLFTFDVFFDRIQGEPAFWLFREAIAIPEPSTACLALMACLSSLRLRAFA